MSEAVVKALTAAGRPRAVVHHAYDDADHGIAGPGWTPVPERLHGGTRGGTAHARAQGWAQVVPFLKSTLGLASRQPPAAPSP